MPLSAGVVLLSYRLKKRAPESKHWIIPQAVFGSIHAGSALRNLFLVAGDCNLLVSAPNRKEPLKCAAISIV